MMFEGSWKGVFATSLQVCLVPGEQLYSLKVWWTQFPILHGRINVPILLCKAGVNEEEFLCEGQACCNNQPELNSHGSSTTWLLCFCHAAACFILWIFSFLMCGWIHLLTSWALRLAFNRPWGTERETGNWTECHIWNMYLFSSLYFCWQILWWLIFWRICFLRRRRRKRSTRHRKKYCENWLSFADVHVMDEDKV